MGVRAPIKQDIDVSVSLLSPTHFFSGEREFDRKNRTPAMLAPRILAG